MRSIGLDVLLKSKRVGSANHRPVDDEAVENRVDLPKGVVESSANSQSLESIEPPVPEQESSVTKQHHMGKSGSEVVLLDSHVVDGVELVVLRLRQFGVEDAVGHGVVRVAVEVVHEVDGTGVEGLAVVTLVPLQLVGID